MFWHLPHMSRVDAGWRDALRMVVVALLALISWSALVASMMLMSPATAQPSRAADKRATGTQEPAGEAIYRRGVLASGKLLEGVREPDLHVQGAAAACTNCHRRSGLGASEGRRVIPPITGRYLFHPRARNAEDLDLPFVDGIRADREPYTDATLARAIREGVDSEGRALNVLMPSFNLGDEDMAALITYLKRLDQRKVAGVTDTVLHFATIITPDADPAKAKGMLDVLEHYFTDKNAFPLGPTPAMRSTRKLMFMVNRRWQLHVWRLTGPASQWQEQLEHHLAEAPVLAVLSGMGGANWAPVQAFCERQALPCLFPNVEVPPQEAEHNFYSLYFSKGVLLEAGLIAKQIVKDAEDKGARGPHVKVVHQIFRAGDSGEAAAPALAALLKREGITVRNHALTGAGSGPTVNEALRQSASADAVVLWLRAPDIEQLASIAAPTTVFMSGLMGGLERAPLPKDWRPGTLVAYPFDLPEQRRIRVDYALGWFAIRHIPVVAEQVQADTYLACGLLAETLNRMADTFVREYLLERIEDMLDHRIITGYYPRLTLASGQRFASKGGRMVRFQSAGGTGLKAETDWTIP